MRCAQHFRPEFLNRVDEIIIFERLSEEDLKENCRDSVGPPNETLGAAKYHTEVDRFGEDGLIAREGYDPVYGARPLKRAIQHELLDPLSINILEGKFVEGQTIMADAKNGTIEFKLK